MHVHGAPPILYSYNLQASIPNTTFSVHGYMPLLTQNVAGAYKVCVAWLTNAHTVHMHVNTKTIQATQGNRYHIHPMVIAMAKSHNEYIAS